ncbi:MAG: DUF2520 domain-containing protein [Bacteroidota bacterium]
MTPKKISIIGSGNVASHLLIWIRDAGHVISSVYTRKQSSISEEFHRRSSLDYQGEIVDYILIATNDDSIEKIADELRNTGHAIILHTSGTVSMDTLALPKFKGYGVLYPLQTLQKGRSISLAKVPFLIEANTETVLGNLQQFCESCQLTTKSVSSDDRLMYHLSAVISSNFVNHLFYIAEKNLSTDNLNFDILRPLIEETIAKAFEKGAYESQTGPAKRGDSETMNKHLDLLKQENYKDIYKLISESIISEYRSE